MTENEYAHLLFIYYNADYCMRMSFQEFLTRYANDYLEVKP